MEVFQQEQFSHDLFQEIVSLAKLHHAEVSTFHGEPLQPNFYIYQSAHELGALRLYTAREKESRSLIGYSVFFVQPDHHFEGKKVARADALFVEPSFRPRGCGLALIRFSDQELLKEGVDRIYRSVSPRGTNLRTILERLHYELAELVFIQKGNS